MATPGQETQGRRADAVETYVINLWTSSGTSLINIPPGSWNCKWRKLWGEEIRGGGFRLFCVFGRRTGKWRTAGSRVSLSGFSDFFCGAKCAPSYVPWEGEIWVGIAEHALGRLPLGYLHAGWACLSWSVKVCPPLYGLWKSHSALVSPPNIV